MSAITDIAWTERTWNPLRGCSVISPGCINCYAMKQAHRFSGPGKPYEGLTKQTSRGPQWTGVVRTVESALLEPLSWRKPSRIFVNSMSDLFHEDVPDVFIDKVFAVMALASRHTFQVLTKRPERMRAYLTDRAETPMTFTAGGKMFKFETAAEWRVTSKMYDCDWLPANGRAYPRWPEAWPLPNVWLGVSVENQHFADERIPLLLQTPAAVRFISAEPLLGPVNVEPFLQYEPFHDNYKMTLGDREWRGLDWVIVGGESGPGARPFDLAWARWIVRKCKAADVPVFVKQLGANAVCRNDERDEGWPGCTVPIADEYEPRYQGETAPLVFVDRKGGAPEEWSADLRIREFPTAGSMVTQ